MRDEVASFRVDITRFLATDGTPLDALPAFADEPGALVEMYRAVVLARPFDAEAVALQRAGRLGAVASSLGREAVAVGIASAAEPPDS